MTSDREPPVFPSVSDDRGQPAGHEPGAGPIFTPAATPSPGSVETAPALQPVSPTNGRTSRIRWAVAGLATLVVVAIVGGVLLLAGPRPGTPSVVEYYVPADSAAYLEARLDFPGDQRERLAAFMGHFPGFADPQAFQRKIDETLEQLVSSADSGVVWSRDVAPWFGGQVALFGQAMAPTLSTPPAVVVALTVKDRAALETFVNARLADHEVNRIDYQGSQIQTFTPDPGDTRVSIVITDEVVLVAPRIEDIQAALDVKAGVRPSLAADPFFLQQLGALHADRLATAYYDMGRVIDAAQPEALGPLPGLACVEEMQSSSRVKLVSEVRAESDHLTITSRVQPPSGANVPPLPSNHASALTAVMPADTIAYYEMRQVGANVKAMVGQLLACLEESGTPIDSRSIEGILGSPPESYLDFVGDAGLALTFRDGMVGGGVVATVDDQAIAEQRVERMLAYVRAFAGFGDGITIDEVEHNAVTITTFTFETPGMGMPTLSLGVAVANARLYIGLNDFVASALDRQAADSLAANDRFEQLLGAGGAENAGLLFVDVARARELVEANLPADQRARYETDVKPFIAPLRSIGAVSRVDNGILVGTVFLYVE